MLNYINILRIIFKINYKLYQKVFKNIIVLGLLNALMHEKILLWFYYTHS
jgi:hypothetical protein